MDNVTEVTQEIKCPDEEPMNIGAYEIPTQRDLVMMYRESIQRMFTTYQHSILDFLRDVKDVRVLISIHFHRPNRII